MDSIKVNAKYKENKKAELVKQKNEIKLNKAKQKTKKVLATKSTKTSSLKKPIKKKTKTRGQLVKELDAVFSKFIRLRDADSKGMCTCITCLDIVYWKNIQNGHFITRSNYKYRWSETNCWSQCMPCNIYKSGNYIAYTLRMIKTLGEDRVKEMQEDKELIKISTIELKEKIEYYKKQVEILLSKVQDDKTTN